MPGNHQRLEHSGPKDSAQIQISHAIRNEKLCEVGHIQFIGQKRFGKNISRRDVFVHILMCRCAL